MTEKTINYIKLPDGETYKIGGSGSGFNLFDTKISDHVLEGEEALGWALQGTYVYKEGVAGSRTGYADFYNKCLAEKENSTVTETTLGDNTITIYVNGNGHKFYDIADKDVVDTFYNAIGIADFYGIDLENERIFLPRNKYFAVTGGVKGNGMTLGLTGGTTDAGMSYYPSTADLKYEPSVFGVDAGENYSLTTAGTSPFSVGITTDSTKSGIVLEPNENKYLYYCVGNTKVESAITDVTEITTSENDTLPLFHNFYSKEDMTTTGAYVNASLGSWLSGNVYATAYNELVNKLGTDNVKANTDTYTDYDFVVNQDEMTFRLPIKNGQEIMFATGVKGNGMTLGLTNGTTNTGLSAGSYVLSTSVSGYGNNVGSDASIGDIANNKSIGITTDSSKSGIELDTENITIPDGWNLYYKVANAVTNLELLDVGEVMAEVNIAIKKTECPAYIVETYQNGTSWYKVRSDGWCEQGGSGSFVAGNNQISLIKPIGVLGAWATQNSGIYTGSERNLYIGIAGTYPNQILELNTGSSQTEYVSWRACGYLA